MALVKVTRQQHPSICAEYQAGKTLAEVSILFGISRERVRQILEENGLNGKSGGIHRKVEIKKEKSDQRFFKNHGCTREQFEIVKGHHKEKSRSPWHAFKAQRRNAKSRGVEWRLVFWDWWLIWSDSGKWDDRGRGTNHYCMCRVGDAGAYEKGNVYIASVTHNSSLGKSLAIDRGICKTIVYSIVNGAGGPTAVSKITGVKAAYISQLCVRNIIPKSWFSDGRIESILEKTTIGLSTSQIFEMTNRI